MGFFANATAQDVTGAVSGVARGIVKFPGSGTAAVAGGSLMLLVAFYMFIKGMKKCARGLECMLLAAVVLAAGTGIFFTFYVGPDFTSSSSSTSFANSSSVLSNWTSSEESG